MTGTHRKSILLSAGTPGRLALKCRRILESLDTPKGDAFFRDLHETAPAQDPAVPRAGFVWDTRQEAVKRLAEFVAFLESGSGRREWQGASGRFYSPKGLDPDQEKLVAVFTGQGVRYGGMGDYLTRTFPIQQGLLAAMDGVMAGRGLVPASRVLSGREKPEASLTQTQYAQPVIGAFTAGLYKILETLGFGPGFVGGLSFGEILGLWAGRVLTDAAFLEVVVARGIAMALDSGRAGEKGAMMAVSGPALDGVEALVARLPDVVVESWNSNCQIVLSGLKGRLEDLQYILQEKGYDAFMMPVSGAFHSPFMAAAVNAFERDMAGVSIQPPELPVFSNLTAAPYPADIDTIRKMITDHIIRPVRFREMIRNISNRGGFCFVEFSPKALLSPMIENILAERPHLTVPLNTGNRTRAQHSLTPPIGVTMEVDGHPPIPCLIRNISKDGLRIQGLPRTLATTAGPLRIKGLRIKGAAQYAGQALEARLIWRQAMHAGLKTADPVWTSELFPALAKINPPDPGAGPDKDCDRQLREAIVRLAVRGYPLKPLDAVLTGESGPPSFHPARDDLRQNAETMAMR